MVALWGRSSFTHLRMNNLRRDIKDAMAEGSLSRTAQIDLFMHIYVAGILSLLARSAKPACRAPRSKAHWAFCCAGGADATLLENIFNGQTG